jgi:hypothetical protein
MVSKRFFLKVSLVLLNTTPGAIATPAQPAAAPYAFPRLPVPEPNPKSTQNFGIPDERYNLWPLRNEDIFEPKPREKGLHLNSEDSPLSDRICARHKGLALCLKYKF